MKKLLLSLCITSLFSFQLIAQLNVTTCPLTNELPCGELVYNGDFDYVSEVPPQYSWSHFGAGIVCNWFDGSGSSDLIFRNSSGTTNLNGGPLLNDPYVRIAASSNPIESETFATLLAGPVNNGDKLTLSAEVRKFGGTNGPDEVKFWLVNHADLINIASPKMENIFNISPKKEIGLVEDFQINSSTFTKFDFCESSDGTYDCLLVLAVGGVAAIDAINLINLNAFDDPDDFIINQCMPNEPLLGDCQDSPSLNYRWAPTTGLSNPYDLFTTVDLNNNRSSYTLRISHPSIFCETYTTVNTYTPPELEDGKDIAWAEITLGEVTLNTIYESSNATFVIEGDFLVDQDWTLTNCKFKMADGAKIRVTNSATLTFNGNADSFIENCGDGTLWDGIYVEGNSKLVLNEVHPFKGSDNGITLSDAAVLEVDYVDFEDNQRCIYSSNTTSSVSLGVTVDHSTFSSIAFQQGTFPGPITFYYPQTAIELNDYTFIVDGSAIIENNVFDGSAGNIVINNTNAFIKNNDFNGFSNPSGSAYGSKNPTSINIIGSNTPTTIPPIYSFVPSIDIQSNYFVNCSKAISSNKDAYFNIQSNLFNKDRLGNVVSGVSDATFYTGNNNYAPDRADSSKSISIHQNEFYNIYYGTLLHNYTTNIRYSSNDLYAVSGAGSKGFLLDASNNLFQFIPNQFTRTDISANNNYYNVHKGNELIAVPWLVHDLSNFYDVENYSIPPAQCLTPPCPDIPGYAVKVLGADNLVLQRAIIQNGQALPTNPILDVSGIVVENCPKWNISCSRMENLPIGLHFIGNNVGYAFNSFTGSRFRDDFVGVALDNYAQIGLMYQETKCIWENVLQHNIPYGYSFYSMNSTTGSLSRQDYRIDYPIVNRGNDGSPFCNNILSSSAPSNGPWVCYGNPYPGGIPRLKSNRKKTAGDSIALWLKDYRKRNASLPSNRARYEQQWATLQYMNDNVLKNDSAAKLFGDSLIALPFGKLIQAQKDRKSDSLLKGMSAVHQFDKDVRFTIRMNKKQMEQQAIGKGELKILRDLAWSCPYEKGIAVIKARNVLGQRGEYNFYNICEFERRDSSLLRKSKLAEASAKIKLFPNPASHTLTLEFNEEPEAGTLLIFYDLLGKEIKQIRLLESRSQTISTEEVESGIYFYRVLQQGEILGQGKQIIQK